MPKSTRQRARDVAPTFGQYDPYALPPGLAGSRGGAYEEEYRRGRQRIGATYRDLERKLGEQAAKRGFFGAGAHATKAKQLALEQAAAEIGLGRDIGADEYGTPPPTAVTDLRLVDVVVGSNLAGVLRWTPPTGATSITLRYSGAPITAANWPSAMLLTDSLPGNANSFLATVPYDGSKLYFALKSRNGEGVGSGLSNNAFWPKWDVYLPLAARGN